MVVNIYSHAEDDLPSVKFSNVCATLTSGSPRARCVLVQPLHKNDILAALPYSSQWGLAEFASGIRIVVLRDMISWWTRQC